MNVFAPFHSERMHVALLHAIARLAPEARREEWLAEWRTELWHAWHAPSPRPEEITAFCLGAYRDALWLRNNNPLPRFSGPLRIDDRPDFPDPPPLAESRFLESPASCLMLLGFPAAICIVLSLLLSTSRHAGAPPFSAPPFSAFLVVFAVSWLIVPVTTRVSLGDYPSNSAWPRRWIFFAAKIALIVPSVVLGAFVIASFGDSSQVPIWPQCAIWIDFWAGHAAIRWALSDQRQRCPMCLRRLAHPVRMGDHSRILLEWNGTELMCLRGHGMLHVPEEPAVWFSKPRWLQFDPSWSRLFPTPKA
jgi:hypothetical protein